jgi:hypothetical protein
MDISRNLWFRERISTLKDPFSEAPNPVMLCIIGINYKTARAFSQTLRAGGDAAPWTTGHHWGYVITPAPC